MRQSKRSTGPHWARSRPLPCGMPSMMSSRTMSPSSLAAAQWAQVAPTFPPPMMEIFARRIETASGLFIPRWMAGGFYGRRMRPSRGKDGGARMRAGARPLILRQISAASRSSDAVDEEQHDRTGQRAVGDRSDIDHLADA